MRPPPKLKELPKFPVTGGTVLLAVGLTFAWMNKVDVSALQTSALIQSGQVWRLLTSTLLHAGIVHLLFDCYWTWVFGTLIESTLGPLKTVGLFVLFGAASSAAEFALLDGGVGLSGVGYGLFGFLWVLSRCDTRFKGAVDRQTVNLFVVWFFICIVATYTGAMRIANLAHGAGLVLGLIVGAATAGSLPRGRRIAAAVAAVVFTAASLAGATVFRPMVNFSAEASIDNERQGYTALMENRNVDAIRWLHKAVRIDPHNASAWYNLGVACDREHHDVEATSAYRKAHELDPANAEYQSAAQSRGDT